MLGIYNIHNIYSIYIYISSLSLSACDIDLDIDISIWIPNSKMEDIVEEEIAMLPPLPAAWEQELPPAWSEESG